MSADRPEGGDPEFAALRALALSEARKVDPDGAEDAAQETIEAYRTLLVRPDNPEAWVRVVARNRAISQWRWRRSAEFAADVESVDPSEALDRLVLHRLALDELTALANSRLSERQMEAFYGLVSSGGNVADAIKLVVAHSGGSPETVRTHLKRAMEKLQGEAPHLRPDSDGESGS